MQRETGSNTNSQKVSFRSGMGRASRTLILGLPYIMSLLLNVQKVKEAWLSLDRECGNLDISQMTMLDELSKLYNENLLMSTLRIRTL